MSFPKAEVIYELNTEQFTPAASTAERALQTVENASKKTAKEIENTERRVNFSAKQMATSLIGLGTAAFSAYQGIDQLEKVQLRAEKAALAVARAQKQVNDLEREGKQGTEEHTIAVERLRIAQEQASQAAGDVKQQTVQLGLSLATTGSMMATNIFALRGMTVAHSTAAGAATAQTAANTGLTLSFRGLTAAMISNPLGLALVAGSIAALAAYQTNLLGVKDRVDDLIGSFTLGKQPVESLHAEFNDGIATTRSYTGSLKDLNSEYQNTLNILKKNDKVKEEFTQTLFLMGSLSSLTKDLVEAGVIDLMSLVQKDTRILPRSEEVIKKLRRMRIDAIIEEEQLARALGFKNRREFEDSLFTPGGIIKTLKPDFKISALGGGLGFVSEFVKAHKGSLSEISDKALLSIQNLGMGRLENLRKEGFGPGAIASILGGRIGRTTAKGKSAKHGGNKGKQEADYIAEALGFRNTAYSTPFYVNRMNANISLLESEGVSMPSYYIMGVSRGRYGRIGVNPNFEAEVSAAIAEAGRRRDERIARQTAEANFIGVSLSEYLTLSQTDIAGMKLYKQLASLG